MERVVEAYPCPLCGSSARQPVRRVSGYSRCECGLVCNDLKDPPEDYQGDYFTAEAPEEGHRDFESAAALHYDERRFGAELDRLGPPTPGARLLDFGSATGSFLAIAARRGWQAVGVEISDEARALAAARGVDSRPDLDDILDLAPFSVITLHHVLEHLADPVGMLRRLAQLLAPGGRIVIEVPNWRSLERRAMASRWMDLRPNQHRWHWEPATLRRAVESAGLAVESVRALGEPIPSPVSVLRSLGVGERWIDALRRGKGPGTQPATESGTQPATESGTQPGTAPGTQPARPVAIAAAAVDAVESRTLFGKRLVVVASGAHEAAPPDDPGV